MSPSGVKAEHDDVAAVARRTGGSLRDLARRAEAEWLGLHPLRDGAVLTAFDRSDAPDEWDEPDPA